MWPRRQWSCWHVELQYLNLHLTHRGALWASGAAQAAQFVRIILRFAVSYRALRGGLTRLGKPDFFNSQKTLDANALRQIKTQPYTAPIISLNSLCAADSFL